MKIGIDLRPINTGEKSGIEEYTINLLKSLFNLDQKNQYQLFLNSFWHQKINLKKLEKYPNLKIISFKYPSKLLNLSLILTHYPYIDHLLHNVDIFFSPNLIFGAVSKKCKHIITFHDLSFEHYPEFFSLKRRMWHSLVSPLAKANQAAKIIAVSNSTKLDLQSLYQIPASKIQTIYPGVSDKFRPRPRNNCRVKKVRLKYHLPQNFILYLGTIEPRKNVESLILAFARLKKNYQSFSTKLVIAGKPGWLYQNVYKLVRNLNLNRDIIFTGFIDDSDKPYLYNLADIFVYPSFYEGFGLPPLEAMASGIPVITSSIASLPEVVQKAALMINPFNIRELSCALEQVIKNQKLRDFLSKEGLTQANHFSWLKCAQETLNLFESVYNS